MIFIGTSIDHNWNPSECYLLSWSTLLLWWSPLFVSYLCAHRPHWQSHCLFSRRLSTLLSQSIGNEKSENIWKSENIPFDSLGLGGLQTVTYLPGQKRSKIFRAFKTMAQLCYTSKNLNRRPSCLDALQICSVVFQLFCGNTDIQLKICQPI